MSELTKVRRHPERGSHDRDLINAILDEAMICHLGFIDDGRPFVIPTMYARAGDLVYLHGSPASRMLRSLGSGLDVCMTVTLLDGLVLARSAFNHSMNYRSVVVMGRGTTVTDPAERMAAFEALVEHVARGRWAHVRQPNPKEMNTTLVIRLSLDEASAKVRSGPPLDAEADREFPTWAGVLPIELLPGEALPDPTLAPGFPVPDHVSRYNRRP
jgi:nitroimidazol reductase NimA-like FMN-containing flavoprotein (pyridoxamine 5'-phosphate oxidase superfamily)